MKTAASNHQTRRTQQATAATPAIQAAGRQHPITINGVTRRLAEVADSVGMDRKTLTLARGMTPEDAIDLIRFPLKAHSTPDEMMTRRKIMLKVIEPLVPVTVRQIYYQMSVHHPDLIANTPKGYAMVKSDMKWLRENNRLPYEHVIDNTRRVVEGYAYDNVADALNELVDRYQPNIWLDMPCLVKFGIEKDALAGTLEQLVLRYQVPLLVVRGYSSHSFLHTEALKIRDEERPVYFYHLGDHDPEGRDACRYTEELLRKFAPDTEIHFEALAVKDEDQIDELGLPTFEAKQTSSRSGAWDGKDCAELDAIAPDVLRAMVEKAINKHMSRKKRDQLMRDDDELDRVRELIEELRP